MRTTHVCLISFLMISAFPTRLAVSQTSQSQRMKPALLVIDIQNQYLTFVQEREKELALYMINAAISLFRHHGFPVIRVYHTDPEFGPEPGTEAFKFPPDIQIDAQDLEIIKHFPSAFKKTVLENALFEEGVNTVFLCGLSAVGCVLATYYGAMERDFKAFMIKDGLMSHNSRYTDFVEEVFETVGYTALNVMLENAVK